MGGLIDKQGHCQSRAAKITEDRQPFLFQASAIVSFSFLAGAYFAFDNLGLAVSKI
jgi:hypothetical protein